MDGPLLTSETYFLTEGVANILASKDLVAVATSLNDKINLKKISFIIKVKWSQNFFRLFSLYID